jgi:Na+-transporting methylmalonyl-CoA/oxaloacetate decarboxylase gamma subunit
MGSLNDRHEESDDGCTLLFFGMVFGVLILFVLVCLFVLWLVSSGRTRVG